MWLKDPSGEWQRRWVVLCGPTLNIYAEQDEQSSPELTVELSSVTGYSEIPTESKYGFQVSSADFENVCTKQSWFYNDNHLL